MPRQKRPLSETDANASNPRAKRVSAGSTTAGDENEASSSHNYEAMSKVELSDRLKARGLPFSGPTKTALIERLKEADAADPKTANAKGNAAAVAPVLEFVTMCRPESDVDMEKRWNARHGDKSGNEDEEDEDEEEEENRCGDGTCMCGKPVRDHVEWKWVISKPGLDMMKSLMKGFWMRDQDAHDVYVCNDWTGYGFQELIENQLLVIDKEMAKNDAWALWPLIEALAHFIPYGSEEWFMSDCADEIRDALKMIGGAVMVSLRQLEREGLLQKDSLIPNIGLVLGQMKYMVECWPGDLDDWQLEWRHAAIFKAKQAGIEFNGVPYGINKKVDELEGEPGDWDCDKVKWDTFDWTKELAAFKKEHGTGTTIGGSHYLVVEEQKKPRAAPKKKAGPKKTAGRKKKAGGGPTRITLLPGERIEDFM